MDLRQPADPDDVACGVCREPVAPERARLLASRDDLAVVERHCPACTNVTLDFVFTADGAARFPADPAGRPLGSGPVTAADVVEMHRYLETWQGDLRALIGGSPSGDPQP